MITYFLFIFIRPKRTIEEILKSNLKLGRLIAFLFCLGLLRGILEVVWIFAINHRLIDLIPLSRQLSWYLFASGPFILANIWAVYLRWAMYSTVFYFTLRFFRIKADFSIVLRVFSIALGLYVLTIVLNFLHLIFNIAMIKFYISPLYAYSMGIGQIISSCLLVLFIYNLGSYLGLDRLSALLSGLFIFLGERIFYFFSAWVYFKLPIIKTLSYKNIFCLDKYLLTLVSILLTFVFLWLGFKHKCQKLN